MKNFFLLVFTLLFTLSSFAQDQSVEKIELSKNSVYVDGSIGLFTQSSLNYERQFRAGEKVSWYGRIGTGYCLSLLDDEGFGGLAGITMLTGRKNGHLEVTAGAFIGESTIFTQTEIFYHSVLGVGYRYQKPKGGFVFRANIGLASIGLGFGYAF